ncbi:MAG: hypothetical protein HY391_04490, partial [Deltaproteobacteria bacterium]|nr:hypothetical protein [Deltaproteobacteria bacterium]
FRSVFAFFLSISVLAIGISTTSQSAAALPFGPHLLIENTTVETLVQGNEWRGFFRDYRMNDNSWPLRVRFIAGDEGELVLTYTFVIDNQEVHGIAKGKIEEGAARFTENDPTPPFQYVLRHLTATILIGEIYLANEAGLYELTGDIFLEASEE